MIEIECTSRTWRSMCAEYNSQRPEDPTNTIYTMGTISLYFIEQGIISGYTEKRVPYLDHWYHMLSFDSVEQQVAFTLRYA